MHRRTFIQLTAVGSAVCAVPPFLAGCGSSSSGSDDKPAVAGTPASSGDLVPPPVTSTSAARQVQRFSDAQGNLYDVYALENRVDFFAPDGTLRSSVTSGLSTPVAIAVDGQGRVLVLELGGQRVTAFGVDGELLGAFAPELALRYPRDVTFGAGVVAVADTLNHRIQLLGPSGSVVQTVGSFGTSGAGLNGPASVTFAADDSIYVADQGNARIAVFSASGRLVDSLGGRGTAAGQFLSPRSLRFDAAGNLHVADAVGGYVSVFDSSRRFVERVKLTMPSGAPGVPYWVSRQTDGSVLYGVIPASSEA